MPLRRPHRAAAALSVAASLLGGCEASDEGGSAAALDLVPANAALYFEVALDPPADQDRALAELTDRLPGSEGRGAEDILRARAAELLGDIGVEFEDLERSFDDTVAGFLVTETIDDYWALLLHVREDLDERALETIEGVLSGASQERHGEVEYVSGRAGNGTKLDVGIVGDFLVVGTGDGFEAAVDTSVSSSLATVPEFEEAVAGIADDRLAMIYLDVVSLQNPATLEHQMMQEELRAAGVLGNGVIAASLSARPDALVVDGSSGFDDGGHFAPVLRGLEAENTLGDLPGHVWLAARVPNVKAAIDGVLELTGAYRQRDWRLFRRGLKRAGLRFGKDVLSWMRDGAFYVGGHSPQTIDAGLLIQSARPTKTADFVRALASLLHGSGVRITRLPSFARDVDFDLHLPRLPGPVHVSSVGGLSLTYGRTLQQAYREEAFLDRADAFERAREALDDGYSPAFFADFPQAVGFVEGTVVSAGGLLSKTYVDEFQPFLERGDYLIHGVAVEDDRILQQIVIGVR